MGKAMSKAKFTIMAIANTCVCALTMALLCCALAPSLAVAEETSDEAPQVGTFANSNSSNSDTSQLGTSANSNTYMPENQTTAMAHSTGNTTTYYYSVDEAMTAAQNGVIIYMDSDWNLTSALTIPENSTVTINMNCHSISTNGSSEVIYMKQGSRLHLTADTSKTFTYKGYASITKYTTFDQPNAEDKDMKDVTIDCGGLITGGRNANYLTTFSKAGGIYMEKYSQLDLKNVAVAGNYADAATYVNNAGGIFANEGCSINLYGGASIEHNKGLAGGIYIAEENVDVTLDGSFIRENYAFEDGGGIYSNNYNTQIYLKNKSSIEGNVATKNGGGIYLNYTNFALGSSDSTGVIKDNVAGSPDMGWNGGGVCVNSDSTADNKGTISGITFSGNTCGCNGAGIYLDQQYTTVSNCTLTGNKATRFGGGIAIHNNFCTIKDSTIRGNVCDTSNINCEGGGVYVYSWYDVKLSGVMIVKDNTRGENGSKDDLFLGTPDWESVIYAYVIGGVSKGSSVGIRTGSLGDVRIGKNINNETKDSFFIDLPGYYVSYGTDEGGDMWQRSKTLKFVLSINGTQKGSYEYDATVAASGTPTSTSKRFWYWDAQSTTGLYPISDFITEDNKFNESLTFAMPQNDVNLVAVYADKIASASLQIDAPAVSKDLPSTGVFKRTDGGIGGADSMNITLTWYEVSKDGTETAVTGAAKAGKTYYAKAVIKPDSKAGLFFKQSITEEDITVYSGEDSSTGAYANYANVSPSTGALSIETDYYEMPSTPSPEPSPDAGGDTDTDPTPDADGGTDGEGTNPSDGSGSEGTNPSGGSGSEGNGAVPSTGDDSVARCGAAALCALACIACMLVYATKQWRH